MSVQNDIDNCSSLELVTQDKVTLIRINRPQSSAVISVFGAQILGFHPQGEQPVIWQNPSADYGAASAIRAGIPICWPWFNVITMNSEEVQSNFADIENPSHGTVRDRVWDIVAVEENSTVTRVTLQTSLEEKNLLLEACYSIGSELEMTLTTTNQSSHDVAFSCALHSYFAISDIADVAVTGLDGCQYIDMIDEMSVKTQDGDIRVDQEVDRMYSDVTDPITLVDKSWQRQVVVKSENSQSTIVWNPWVEKCQRTSQLLDDDYRKFICIETAKTGQDFVALPAGSAYQLDLKISSRSL